MSDSQDDNRRDEKRETGARVSAGGETDQAAVGSIEETIGGREATVFSANQVREVPPSDVPETIGRYRVEKRLGKGGYGSVYLAYDDELRRYVTIKVPHPHRVQNQTDIDRFLAEARTLAKLEHPNVVPVHDLGRTDEGLCYIVSRYIDGSDLFVRMQANPLSLGEVIDMVATLAEALHYVHNMGVIHRDIKPNNILLDKRGVPYLADFGLALLEDDAVRSGSIAGTPAYMSPEQARGENHLVEGTSDTFSLGIVLYKLATGEHPFAGDNSLAILRAIQEQDVRPLREVNRDVPAELERICMKALSKRACDRHTTALNLAEDLRHLLSQGEGLHLISGVSSTNLGPTNDASRSSRQFLGIVPKGLRSFGSQDAHFFLGLLPGPYDRDGIPESIQFWKSRIEDRDPENSFRVGLIYGPSGCGKSSFIKAGLIPTLADDVVSVFVEAAPGATENRLLNRLRRKCPYLDTKLNLPESIAMVRRGSVVGEGNKVLLVIDQFEQWLYSVQQPEHSELAKALRQCDSEHVQCILLVRDDFWLAFSRFMDHLEVELLQNKNMALIDLFDKRHAARVLTEFGRAFRRLPPHGNEFSRDQKSFVTQAIDGLAENGKVTPVRIALFAEMIKDKPWATSTLRKIGGTSGVGVMFLDENFVADSAPADYRIHQKATYAALAELLPQPGANLKGHMKSEQELMDASGYTDKPKQFDALIRILDSELHLITRTDPEGHGDASTSQSGNFSSNLTEGVYYQLAHDYLVPSIREWQERMQRGTRRGRAEIRLTQRAEIWNTRPDSRHLPTWTEWVSIMLLTSRKRWDETQQKMMRSATRRHTISTAVVSVLLLLFVLSAYQFAQWNQAQRLTGQLATASVSQVSGLLEQLRGRERWTSEPLRAIQASAEPGSSQHLFASVALLRKDPAQLSSVQGAVLRSDPDTLLLLRDELFPHRREIIEQLWSDLEDETLTDEVDSNGRLFSPRFNAAMMLASFDPPGSADSPSNERWEAVADYVAERLVYFANIDRSSYRSMVSLIQPASPLLADRLARVMVDSDAADVLRSASQRLLEDLLRDDPVALTDQMLKADIAQIQTSIQLIDKHRDAVRPLLESVVQQKLDMRDPDWKENAKRKATAAALLLRHGISSDDVWNVFKSDIHPPFDLATVTGEWIRDELERLFSGGQDAWEEFAETDDRKKLEEAYVELTFGRTKIPNARTRLVHRMAPLEMDGEMLARRLLIEGDVEIRCGLMHALGELAPDSLGDDVRGRTLDLIKSWYASANEAALHTNALWFLKRWEPTWLETQNIQLPSEPHPVRNWYVNNEGQTMVLIPQHEADDRYRVEVATTEVTLGQLLRWRPNGQEERDWRAPNLDCAAGNVTYDDAVAYCNWLSREEGLDEGQLAYPDREEGPGAPSVMLYPDYTKRTGYRLPMASEWFFMCNAGAITDYSFGSGAVPGALASIERISDGYSPSRPTGGREPWEVGIARPNDFGLFNTYMNVREWANDIDPNDPTRIQVCGHDFRFHWGMTGVTPRYLGWSQPHAKSGFYGFRVVRSRPSVGQDD